MGRATPRTDWVRSIQRLTVEPNDDRPHERFDDACSRIARLTTYARQLAGATAADFPGHPDAEEAAALARDLAVTAPAPAAQPPSPLAADRSTAAGAYLEAVRDAATAVYYCRRVQHPAGACWFSESGPVADVCGRVLALTHRLRRLERDQRQRDDHTGAPT